jgi:uncharacterized membrane protein YdfJ with MMPL/SSD domain
MTATSRPRTWSRLHLRQLARLSDAHPEFRIEEFGHASSNKEVNEAFEDDFRQAKVSSLPITLIILLSAFGAVVAAVVPLLSRRPRSRQQLGHLDR